VDGDSSPDERVSAFHGLREGDVTVLSSVSLLSEGFDEPIVSCVLLLRPTDSKGLYIQQVGRGLRQHRLKRDCVVLDMVGNTARHGCLVGPRAYRWEGDGEEPAAKGDGVDNDSSNNSPNPTTGDERCENRRQLIRCRQCAALYYYTCKECSHCHVKRKDSLQVRRARVLAIRSGNEPPIPSAPLTSTSGKPGKGDALGSTQDRENAMQPSASVS
jgi:superfamily II DNA or RNA helicase